MQKSSIATQQILFNQSDIWSLVLRHEFGRTFADRITRGYQSILMPERGPV